MLKQRSKPASKVTAILLALMMAVVFMPTFGLVQKTFADDQSVSKVKVNVLLQAEENTLTKAIQSLEVSSDTAEQYGYTEPEKVRDPNAEAQIPLAGKVTTLDVLVQALKELYGDAFTAETAKDYLTVNTTGTITKIFGVNGILCGFTVNGSNPLYSDGATGSVIDDSIVEDGDSLRFFRTFDDTMGVCATMFFFSDEDQGRYELAEGDALAVPVKADYAFRTMLGASFCDANPLDAEGATVVIKDSKGEVVASAKVDKNGIATINGLEGGKYSVVVSGNYEGNDWVDEYVTPYAEAVVVAKPTKIEVAAIVRNFAKVNQFDIPPQVVEVSSDAAESYGDYGDILYGNNNGVVTLADVMYTLQKLKYGDAFTKETAANFIQIYNSGWFAKVFKEDASYTASAINEDLSMVGGAYETTLSDGDQLDYWKYVDTTGYSDTLTAFPEKEITAKVGEEIELQVKGIGWGGSAPIYKAEGEDFTLALYDNDGVLTSIEGAVMDKDGIIKAKFDAVGEYYISASGKIGTNDYFGNPTTAVGVLPWAKVTVTPAVDLSVAKIKANTATYTGGKLTPDVTVTLDGNTVDSKYYDVSFENNINVGTGKVIVVGKNGYYGKALGTFTIEKASQTIKSVQPLKKTYKASKKTKKLAKKKTFRLEAVSTGDSKVSVTFAKANKAGGKKIKISKTGKVTVKKGLKKGTYKVKVKMNKAGNQNYNAAKTVSKTLKITIK